jgi:CubicO group peptidase (beta-lactamase class C family)
MALLGLAVSLGACGDARPASADTAAQIDGILSAEYPAGEPGAAVLVSKDGKVILRKGYGFADTERKAPVTPDTVFRLASLTKIFTGTAVLMLA